MRDINNFFTANYNRLITFIQKMYTKDVGSAIIVFRHITGNFGDALHNIYFTRQNLFPTFASKFCGDMIPIWNICNNAFENFSRTHKSWSLNVKGYRDIIQKFIVCRRFRCRGFF
ncbi:hypothetical protein A7979_04750 [Rothia nasimurium]|uniref:Uncharacterized protein n=1 Tax=Rothia nasimurium TaxID=85336 RepID=A0A1Y1RMU9_9MICC|nr:hypothetical protein A7979_04750 [Rothia nasimurium]